MITPDEARNALQFAGRFLSAASRSPDSSISALARTYQLATPNELLAFLRVAADINISAANTPMACQAISRFYSVPKVRHQ